MKLLALIPFALSAVAGCVTQQTPTMSQPALPKKPPEMNWVVERAKPVLDRSRTPALPKEVNLDLRPLVMRISVCTDAAGKVASAEVLNGSGIASFDRSVRSWVSAMPFQPAIDLKNVPIADCGRHFGLAWIRARPQSDASVISATPVLPLLLPDYPKAALRRADTGDSVAKICLDEKGHVTEVRDNVSPTPILGDAFEDWLRRTPFQPVVREGRAIAACDLAFGVFWTVP